MDVTHSKGHQELGPTQQHKTYTARSDTIPGAVGFRTYLHSPKRYQLLLCPFDREGSDHRKVIVCSVRKGGSQALTLGRLLQPALLTPGTALKLAELGRQIPAPVCPR